MFEKIASFSDEWRASSEQTGKVLDRLTDESLDQPIAPGFRTLGQVAWHIVTTIPEMGSKIGLRPDAPDENAPVPSSAGKIADTYRKAAGSLVRQIEKEWTDENLQAENDMYGLMWKKGFSLLVLLQHEIHHRGQMTVLMRQAGLTVPGVCGPSKEEWEKMGMAPPEK